jgi:hypothetical protein
VNASRIAVVVLIVLLVLFAAGTLLNARGQPPPTAENLQPSWINSLAERLVPRRNAGLNDLEQIAPACGAAGGTFRLQPGAGCTLRVKAAALPDRRLAFTLRQGQSAVIVVAQPVQNGERMTAKETLNDGGTSRNLHVYREGADVAMTCVGMAACALQLVP